MLIVTVFGSIGWIVGGFHYGSERSKQLAELAQRRETWARTKPEYYAYRFARSCYCSPSATLPRTIFVDADGIRYEIAEADAARYQLRHIPRDDLMSIEQVFESVENALEKADTVSVDYDRSYGFPTRLWVDSYSGAIDDEYTIQTTDFRTLIVR